MRLTLLMLAACVRPLPLPPPDERDYCSSVVVMPAEDRRILCGQYPREPVLDGGS